MKNNSAPKTLLIRMDKIGDLVVSLNASDHPWFKDHDYHWFISQGLGWVLENSPHKLKFTEATKTFSLKSFFQLVRDFKSSKADSAVVFQAPWFVGLALFLAGIPQRVGRLSQWHSYLFFNHGIRQKRSLSKQHESKYNWELISKGFLHSDSTPEITQPILTAPPLEKDLNLPQKYCVIHPGMMGSALNWPIENYIALTKNLSEKISIVVTGTKADEPWTGPLKKALGFSKNILWLQNTLNPNELLAVLKGAHFVVAPSTGVIHLAAALGTPVVGFYSPRLPERETRWGPLTKKSLIFTPPLGRENQEDCMNIIEPDEVFKKICGIYLK